MTGDWEATEHPQIQVRAVVKTADELPLREYDRLKYTNSGHSVDVVRVQPIFSLNEPVGYQARVQKPEPEPGEGEVKCERCRRVVAKGKSGKPWKHKCEPQEPGWTPARHLDETPAKAIARGWRMLGLDKAEQITLDVGDGKKRAAA